MAFKKTSFAPVASADPALHFKSLTKRYFPDVMPHQKEILETYAKSFVDCPDIALQLPTGSGKTLVGLLIADWRRIKNGERAVYLCPTKQLVKQTVEQAQRFYGLDVVDLSGKKGAFAPADKTAFQTGKKIAVSTYSALFNSHTYFESPDLIIVDDAHAAENYIANMWSLEIEKNSPLHDALSAYLQNHISEVTFTKLTGQWLGTSDSHWVEKIPSPVFQIINDDVASIIDSFATSDSPDLYFKWSAIRGHLDACHLYMGIKGILIRPLLPPTHTHRSFTNACQRIFMSATLGLGGDLERLTGRKNISRLPAPAGFQSSGVGRRFFIFPTLSLEEQATETLLTSMQRQAGRSVILTPSTPEAESHIARIKANLSGFAIHTKSDIENNKQAFASSTSAVAVLANRYDGIDFPGDECRLLHVDGLPKAMNLQEKFIMSKMGAGALFNDRVQTRVLQAMGRCTRALQDRSAVIVTGGELVDFLADSRKWLYFPPELQAELVFSVEQSTETTAHDIFENFRMFQQNNADWAEADNTVRTAVASFTQSEFPEMSDLSKVANLEIDYQTAIWNRDFATALAKCRQILCSLNHSNLKGYRALWHYLAGSASNQLSILPDDAYAQTSREHFLQAKNSAPIISWLNALTSRASTQEAETPSNENMEILNQVESIERLFTAMGVTTNHKFERKASEILTGLSDNALFESAQVKLGELLGFIAGNVELDAAPDPWWLGTKKGIVFETHAGADDSSILGATKSRQASTHADWLSMYVDDVKGKEITAILLTPCRKAGFGAAPTLQNVHYWQLVDFLAWVNRAIDVLRQLKSQFPGEGDLVWRANAVNRLDTEGITIQGIINKLPLALQAMEIVN